MAKLNISLPEELKKDFLKWCKKYELKPSHAICNLIRNTTYGYIIVHKRNNLTTKQIIL